MTGDGPMYRDLWLRVRDALPRKGIKDTPIDGLPVIPKELEGALRSLYADYERGHQAWADAGMGTPPVFIVVCSNTATSKLVYDWIAGWEKELPDGSKVVVPGNLELFSNEQDGRYRDRPNTLLVDSAQLDRGDALDPAFRKAAAAEIERFKREYVTRFPGRSAEDITDEDILREVMNTVGKRGRLGEDIRCVVSVAMLTEGWDANTVTHILGIRAFGTQLLCEQVVGRALRRASYDPTPGRHVRARVRRGLRRPVQLPVRGRDGEGQGRQGRPRGPGAPRAGGPADRVPAPDRLPLRDADRPPGRDLRRVVDPVALDPGRRDQDGGRPDRRPDRDPRDRPSRSPHADRRLRGRQADARQPLPRRRRRRAALALPAARPDHQGAGSTSASCRT